MTEQIIGFKRDFRISAPAKEKNTQKSEKKKKKKSQQHHQQQQQLLEPDYMCYLLKSTRGASTKMKIKYKHKAEQLTERVLTSFCPKKKKKQTDQTNKCPHKMYGISGISVCICDVEQ